MQYRLTNRRWIEDKSVKRQSNASNAFEGYAREC